MSLVFRPGCIDDNMSMAGSIQPDIKQAMTGLEESPEEEVGESGPEEYLEQGSYESEYPIDPVTGLPRILLETGGCPENDLGETRPLPLDIGIADIPGSKNEVG